MNIIAYVSKNGQQNGAKSPFLTGRAALAKRLVSTNETIVVHAPQKSDSTNSKNQCLCYRVFLVACDFVTLLNSNQIYDLHVICWPQRKGC